ncbi:MAG: cupin domain-containing protein [Clostridiaceae bacterium]|nr:cupin domain-containing protein [Clostridiaceae bacterium]
MLYKKEVLNITEVDKNKGGIGISKTTHITDQKGLCDKGRLYGLMELEPGCSVGSHVHEGDMEIYYFLEGEGEVTDNGVVKKVFPGDALITNNGEEHSLKNIGNKTFKWMALILYV